jgi:hypothetical protein
MKEFGGRRHIDLGIFDPEMVSADDESCSSESKNEQKRKTLAMVDRAF